MPLSPDAYLQSIGNPLGSHGYGPQSGGGGGGMDLDSIIFQDYTDGELAALAKYSSDPVMKANALSALQARRTGTGGTPSVIDIGGGFVGIQDPKTGEWIIREANASGSSGPNYGWESAEAQKNRDFQAAQAELDRQIDRERVAAQERQGRLDARDRFMQYLNSISSDDARLNSGLQGLAVQGTTPTIGFGNALQQGINTLNTQIATPPPTGTPLPSAPIAPLAAPQGMAQGGSFGPMGDITWGSNKEAILVGEERSGIDGSAEVAIRDKRTGALQEIIPLAGGAAEGATVNTYSDPTSVYGNIAPLYQPFGITGAGAVPTRANATPTSLGYVAPQYSTDFSPVQPPAYGPLSEQFFSRTTGMLLPNPSTILRQLRVLREQSPTVYGQAMLEYAASTNAAGKPSGLNPLAIEAMINSASIGVGNDGSPVSRTLIGIR